MKSRFWVFLTVSITAAMIFLAACQPAAPVVTPEPPSTGAVDSTPAFALTEVKLTPTATQWVPMKVKPGQTKVVIFVGFGTGTSAEQQAAHLKLQETFNRTHEKIQIEFLTVPYAERGARFSQMLAEGNSPDILMPIGVTGISEFYDEWTDLTPYIIKDKFDMGRFIDRTIAIHTYAAKGTLGLPMCMYPAAVMYNRDLFDAAGVAYPPHKFGEAYADGQAWDYNKVVEIARELSLDANGYHPGAPDFDPKNMRQWGWDGWDWFNNIEYAAKFGGEPGTIVSLDKKRSLLGTQQYRDAVKFNKQTVWDWNVRATEEQAMSFYDKSGDPFGSGQVGMWEIQSWMKYAWAGWTKNFAWDIAATPRGPNGKIISIVDADTLVIPKASQHKEAAWEVVKWFFEQSQLQSLVDIYGCVPADKELAASWVSRLKTQYPDVDAQVLVDALDYVETTNHESWRPEYSKINGIVSAAMEQINSGENLNVDAVLDEADRQVQAVLDEYWKTHK